MGINFSRGGRNEERMFFVGICEDPVRKERRICLDKKVFCINIFSHVGVMLSKIMSSV
jgi:hypothetical protein